MSQKTLKLLFSFIMVFSLMAPTIAPFCAQDWYKMVMMGGTNEEEHQDKTPETLKKLNEKDLIYYDLALLNLHSNEQNVHHFKYWALSDTIVFDIPLPPPEHTI